MARVLVLGARGFLGAHVADAARNEPGVDVITPGRNEIDVTGDVATVSHQLTELAPDAVVACIGRLDGTTTEFVAAHVVVTATLIDAIAAMPRPARLVRIGSAGEYGPVPLGRGVREDDPTQPVSAYGASHLAATHLLRTAVQQGQLSGTNLRVFNPLGAGAHGPNLASQATRRLIEALDSGAAEITMGPLTTWRDFVDAHDVGRAAVAAALADADPPAVLNIGAGRASASREVVTTLAELAGYTGTIRETAPPPGRSAGVSWIQADITLAEQSIGWAPRNNLTDSLRALWFAAAPQPEFLTSKEAS